MTKSPILIHKRSQIIIIHANKHRLSQRKTSHLSRQNDSLYRENNIISYYKVTASIIQDT